jgi:hypothetical protein
MKRMGLLALVLFSGGVTPAAAQEKQEITVAIYAPNVLFDDAAQRFAYVQRLADALSRAPGLHATGKAFARPGDFEAAVKKGQVDFAVVDAVYLAGRASGGLKVLATATSGGQTAQSWRLYASPQVGAQAPFQLSGKRLAYAGSGGARDTAFLENVLLDGVVQVARFFPRRETAPDVASAVTTVSLGRADAVFAPEGKAHGLKSVGDVLARVPLPAFCAVRAELSQQVVNTVAQAVTQFGGGAVLDGWKAGGAAPYDELRRRMQPRPKRPLMAEPDLVRFEDRDALNLGVPEPALPDVGRYYVLPSEK